jgi:hypothetical protein
VLLIHEWFAQADLTPVYPEDQVTQGINGGAVRALERERDGPGIGPGGDHEVVFQLPLVAVVDEIHTRVDSPVLDLRVGGNVGPPLLGIIADEVVALARQFPHARHHGCAVGPDEPHPQHGTRERFAPFRFCRG